MLPLRARVASRGPARAAGRGRPVHEGGKGESRDGDERTRPFPDSRAAARETRRTRLSRTLAPASARVRPDARRPRQP